MKKRALGSFCVTNIISSIGVSLFFIMVIVFYFYTLNFDGVLYTLLSILYIFIALQRLFRVIGCYYEIKANSIVLKYISIKKRTKWYDFMCFHRRARYSYQKAFKEINYNDIESFDLLYRSIDFVSILRKNELAIKLKNGRYVWIVKNVFSKKQLREIIKCIQEKNNKVEISDYLKQYLKISSL